MVAKANGEFKKVIRKIKERQVKLQGMLRQSTWVDEARRFAEKQAEEVRKMLESDSSRLAQMKTFIERERKGFEKFQKQLPSEVKKFKKFVDVQKKELEKLLQGIRKAGLRSVAKKKKSAKGSKKANRARPAAKRAAKTGPAQPNA